jgi:drug/metabolite transporter (DMT)-like permease
VPSNFVARWFLYAVTFGLTWGFLADALIHGDGAAAAATRGTIAGVLFATVAIRRERRGVRRRSRRP